MFWLGLGRAGGGLDILWPTLGPQEVSLEQDLSRDDLCSKKSTVNTRPAGERGWVLPDIARSCLLLGSKSRASFSFGLDTML